MYERIEVARNGAVLEELSGDARAFTDTLPAPGYYWYRVRGFRNGTASPWSLAMVVIGIANYFILKWIDRRSGGKGNK